jgi:TatD DNase family protein
MCIATRIDDYDALLRLKQEFPENVFISLGQHPSEGDFSCDIARQLLNCGQINAVGETGFDCKGDLKRQRVNFDLHAQLATDFDLPIILHTRSGVIDVEDETIAALKNWPNLRGVFHCFAGSQKLADFAQSIGWKVSFSGIITFKNANDLRAIAKTILHHNLLIETDSPYLSPEPFRGQTNSPSNARYIGEYIAKMLKIDTSSFAEIVYKNYFSLFGHVKK